MVDVEELRRLAVLASEDTGRGVQAEYFGATRPKDVLALLDRIDTLERAINTHKSAMDHHGGDIDFSLWSALEDFSWK